jgi:hypothetical protein
VTTEKEAEQMVASKRAMEGIFGRMKRGKVRKKDVRLAKMLGWFSIGLGAAELLVPRRVAHLIGVPYTDRVRLWLLTMGVREIAHGVAILARPTSASRVWTRVGGDVLDLSLLGSAMAQTESSKPRVAGAMTAVLGATALDLYDTRRLTNGNGRA